MYVFAKKLFSETIVISLETKKKVKDMLALYRAVNGFFDGIFSRL